MTGKKTKLKLKTQRSNLSLRPTVSRIAPSEKNLDDADDEELRRPGEIRFGGMSFALPPPGDDHVDDHDDDGDDEDHNDDDHDEYHDAGNDDDDQER